MTESNQISFEDAAAMAAFFFALFLHSFFAFLN